MSEPLDRIKERDLKYLEVSRDKALLTLEVQSLQQENTKLKEALKKVLEQKEYIPIVELSPEQKKLISDNDKLKEALTILLDISKEAKPNLDFSKYEELLKEG